MVEGLEKAHPPIIKKNCYRRDDGTIGLSRTTRHCRKIKTSTQSIYWQEVSHVRHPRKHSLSSETYSGNCEFIGLSSSRRCEPTGKNVKYKEICGIRYLHNPHQHDRTGAAELIMKGNRDHCYLHLKLKFSYLQRGLKFAKIKSNNGNNSSSSNFG